MKKLTIYTLILLAISTLGVLGLALWQPLFVQPVIPSLTEGFKPDLTDPTGPSHPAMPANDKDTVGVEQKTTETNSTIVRTSNLAALKDYARSHGLTINRITTIPSQTEALVDIAEASTHSAIRALSKKLPDTKVSTNHVYQAAFTPNDTNYPEQWNLPKISAPAAWDLYKGSAETTIAVIDTGTLFDQSWGSHAYSQPDFPTDRRWENVGEIGSTAQEGPAPNCTSRGLALDKACNNLDDDGNGKIDDRQGWDFMGGHKGNANCPNYTGTGAATDYVLEDNDPQPYSCDSPTHPTALNKTHFNGTCQTFESACYVGHGTIVGSTATAATNNSSLIAGVNHQAKLMNLRVIDGYGFTTTSLVTAAVRYATAMNADVINLSLSVTNCTSNTIDETLDAALRDAKNAGIVIAAASGNGGSNIVCYPASSSHAIAVGASDRNDQKASFSSYGSTLDIVAPGVGIPAANAPSDSNNSLYHSGASGTSLATPHVAGAAGLLKGLKPTATADEIIRLITEGADEVPAMHGHTRTDEYGHGRLNLYNAFHGVKYAAQSSYPTIPQGESATVFLSYKNDGLVPWYDDTAISNGTAPAGAMPVHLATGRPLNRASIFADASWSGSDKNRPTVVFAAVYESDGTTLAADQHVGQPGQIVRFSFKLQPFAYLPAGTYREHFYPIIEGTSNGALNDPGTYLNITVTVPTSAYKAQAAYPTLVADNSAQTVWLEYTNTSTVTWYDDTGLVGAPAGTKPVHLATNHPINRASVFGNRWNNHQNRPALNFDTVYRSDGTAYTTNPHLVQPGESVRFSFAVSAPFNLAPGIYREHFQPLIEGGSIMNDPGTYLEIAVVAPVYTAAYRSQCAYPTLSRGGASVECSFRYKNTGNANWYDDTNLGSAPAGTKPIHLATSHPINRASVFGSTAGGAWCNNPHISRPTCTFTKVYEADNTTEVVGATHAKPGQIVEVRFPLTAPADLAPGIYREHFRLLVEAGSIMNDPGTYLEIAVQ